MTTNKIKIKRINMNKQVKNNDNKHIRKKDRRMKNKYINNNAT